MRKTSVILVFVLILLSAAAAAAESYDIVSNWMDLFYRNGNDPWSLTKKDLSFLNQGMPGFSCQNVVTGNEVKQMRCSSEYGKYKGMYRVLFSFTDGYNPALEKVEFIVDHPDLTSQFNNYGQINYQLRTFVDLLKKKTYISPKLIETEMAARTTIHTLSAADSKYYDVFRFPGSAVSVGYKDQYLILSFCSEDYYISHSYYERTDPQTGETSYVFIMPE